MARVDTLRDEIIGKLYEIADEGLLTALNEFIDSSGFMQDVTQLTPEQIEMLEMSEEDIKAGRVISHEELDKSTRAWLKGLSCKQQD